MRKIFATLLLIVCVALTGMAQDVKVGVLDSKALFEAMPESSQLRKELQQIDATYKSELSTLEDEYQNKVSTFLSEKDRLTASIQEVRMQEIDQLQQRVENLRRMAADDIHRRQNSITLELRHRINEAIQEVSKELGLICVLNTASDAVLFFSPEQTIDLMPLLLQKLLPSEEQ